MLKAITTLLVLFIPYHTLHAKTLANCSSPSGYAFYPHIGLATKKDSGWAEDKISGMRTTVTYKDGELDVLYIDVTDTLTSSADSGAKILPVIASENYFTVLSIWFGSTTELYTFWKNKDNQYKFSLTQVKGGVIPKSSVLVGDCSFIDFTLIE